MARVRFIGPEPVTVPELGGRSVQPDEVVEVPDHRYDGYVCQSSTWEPVDEPREPEPLVRKAVAARAAKEREV
ncbi:MULTISPECIES: hypothetical protein [Streptomyces]|uniref:Uncharacterized protein n=2 Tax=Streptomyces TaxID=1883 RepID=A0A100Y664_9ACTN|nr:MULTISPECIES: hypothetical protein [Streptomyces]KUH38385.1 hypothetical protein ATE80_13025 [Streptomyces kanasensis]UUS30830.1 hypothetical protein NRO40_08270 [Streptomyces changanensis]